MGVQERNLINIVFPLSATSGDDMLDQLKRKLASNPGHESITAKFRESLIIDANTFWNIGVVNGLTVNENLVFVKQKLLEKAGGDEKSTKDGAIIISKDKPFGGFTPGFTPTEIGGAISDIIPDIPDIPNPFATLEWFQKNWLLILIAVVVAIIIIIIVFSVMVTGPLMEAVMIGALS